jgi:CheY-like chemotaxis protein
MSERLRILLVDDEEIVNKRLRPALERDGYEVESQMVGKNALASIAAKEFDVVVTDMRIDEVNGLHVLEAARKKSPQVMSSGEGRQFESEERSVPRVPDGLSDSNEEGPRRRARAGVRGTDESGRNLSSNWVDRVNVGSRTCAVVGRAGGRARRE